MRLKLLEAYQAEIEQLSATYQWKVKNTYRSEVEQALDDWDLRPTTLPAGRAILEADAALQAVVNRLITRHFNSFHHLCSAFWLGFRALKVLSLRLLVEE